MKNISLICIMFMSALSFAITPVDLHNKSVTVTAEFFAEACTVIGETHYGMIPDFDCESYIYGVLDTYLALNGDAKNTSDICLPKEIAPWQVYQIFLDYYPKQQHSGKAAPLIIESLGKSIRANRLNNKKQREVLLGNVETLCDLCRITSSRFTIWCGDTPVGSICHG